MIPDESTINELPEPISYPTKNPDVPPLQTINNASSDDNSSPAPVSHSSVDDSDASDTPIADDAELIEKEWIARAKAVVNKYSHDPYSQSEGMSQIKFDYLKKRYNKTISVKE
ncbi:hypothetical protein KA068_00300 [Candidatus Saccharibacteria bacterium]|jgi:hypothetical protein|nr:hypothetical protein [Candidatus Saccharibacteria bacterium]